MTERAYQQGFGSWMKQQRDELGIKQPELARRLEVSESSVSNWERGLASMTAYTERKIRAVFREERELRESTRKAVTA